MRIRTRLKLNTALIVLFALVNGGILFSAALKTSDLLRIDEMSSDITKGVFDLNLLTYEYFHYNSQRSFEQWQTKHQTIHDSLQCIQTSRPDEQPAFARIDRQLSGIKNVMEQIAALRNSNQPNSTQHLENRLINNVLASSQTIIADVFRLEQRNHQNLEALPRKALAVSVGFSSLLALAIVFFSLRMRRTIVTSLSDLENAAEALGAGTLDHRISTITPDEIGHVATEFNQMADKLQQTYSELAHEYSERVKAELFNRNILENVGEGLIVVDREYRIVLANRAFLEQTGRTLEDVLGSSCYRMAHASPVHCCELGQECMVKQAYEQGISGSSIHKHYSTTGEAFTVEAKAYPMRDDRGEVIAVIEIINDITENVRLEQQVRQSQKMEAIGTLAGGIAHDFNNILTPLLGYTEMAQLALNSSEGKLATYLNNIGQAGLRAKDLVQQILTFSRQGEQQKAPLQLANILKEALKLIRSSLPSSIEIRQDIRSSATVLADPTQIHQVIMNLCTNAFHAMGQGGILGAALYELACNDSGQMLGEAIPDGRYLVLEISDTGCGMSKEIIDKIYEPFFTTKETGKGTGLGLAVVHGIVKDHGGRISVYSEPGAGSTFRIYLPVSSEEPRPANDNLAAEPVRGNNELLLYVDDEDHIRAMAAEYLTHYGYRVETCADGAEAVQLLSERTTEFDLLITDMTMPVMNGSILIRKAKQLRPDLPVILCTGYSTLVTADTVAELGIQDLIQKPVAIHDVLRRIQLVLHPEAGEEKASDAPYHPE